MPVFILWRDEFYQAQSAHYLFLVATTVESIIAVCRYAICLVPNWMGLVIRAYESDSRKMFLELSRKWHLECPVCQHSFVIADSELKTDEIFNSAHTSNLS